MQQPVDIFMRRSFRFWIAFAAAGNAFQLIWGMTLLAHGESIGWNRVFTLCLAPISLVYFGWVSYVAWRYPVLCLGPNEISWRPPGTRRARRLALTEVTGFRWPMPKDLWIEGARGETLRIPMIGIRASDRERVRAWLGARWVDGGFIDPSPLMGTPR